MANWKTKITVGNKVVSFPIEKARSVHLIAHTLLRLKNRIGIKGKIIRNNKVIFSI